MTRPDHPLVSVVIPAYQHGRDLPSCLDSLFAQTLTDFEVIVVDDGSTDDTAQRLQPYAARLKVISQANQGGNAARNRGAAEARGEFIVFCDADVVMRPDMLETLVGALAAHPEAAYAYSSFAMGWKEMPGLDFSPELLRRANFIHTTSLIRRDRFPGFDPALRKFQDWDLWLTMLECGDGGVFVPERLFRCITHRGGISQWLPAAAYQLPWGWLGWKPRALARYEAADRIIRDKHGLGPRSAYPAMPSSSFWVWRVALLAFFLLELASFVGFFSPAVGAALFAAAALGTFALAWRWPEVGLLAVVGELLAGSQGGYLLAVPVGGAAVSLRLGLFAAVMAAWAVRGAAAWRRGGMAAPELAWLAALRDGHGRRWLAAYLAALAVIAVGFCVGLARGNRFADVFLDANGYFFLALAPVFLAAWGRYTWERLAAVVSAGLAVAVAKALFILYVFSHRLVPFASDVYTWVRDTRVGEITLMDADYYRVFFQSQVFALSGGLVALVVLLFAHRWREQTPAALTYLLMAVAMLLSLSRSFWFAALAAGGVLAAWLLWRRAGFAVWRRFLHPLISLAMLAGIVISAAYAFPFPDRYGSGRGLTSVFGSRMSVTGDDAASVSRWALLQKLHEAIAPHPLIGSGLGTTVTYQTADPRLVEQTGDGVYTTYAFEWGFHDVVLKFGLLGFAVLMAFFGLTVWPALAAAWRGREFLRAPAQGFAAGRRPAVLAAGVTLAYFALFATNVFSPYLNHPLGLGLVLLVAAMGVRGEFDARGPR
jgi:glycosyltransferase involved in cell wall biosynthesis